VFLSYASQDVEVAQKICDALHAAGIEVWFDKGELRGGDAWDQKIRREIHECALFIPIVSQHTQERLEGYFRHEWKLAIERAHHMAEEKPFLVPVVVDGTSDQEAFVPDAFRAVHWTPLPGGDTPAAFVERIERLLSPELSPLRPVSGAAQGITRPGTGSWRIVSVLTATVAVFAALTYLVADKLWISKHISPSPTAFAPPPHSIAVLPFVNMSGDKEQEYFSDGLSEELLNSLSRISELQVAARTSSFYFKGEHADLPTIAHKLNVASVLEGSVRRSGQTIRITAQLNNAVTGFHLWSQTYDRDLSDVLALQTDIANSVASALKITLLGDVASKVEVGGTHNPGALDAYLRAASMYYKANTQEEQRQAIKPYTEAIRLDPNYALAFAARSILSANIATFFSTGSDVRDDLAKARTDAERAIALAPGLAESHLALAIALETGLDFDGASQAFDHARALAPHNSRIERNFGYFAVLMGRTDSGISAARYAVTLDPLDHNTYADLAGVLIYSRHYEEAASTYQNLVLVEPKGSCCHDKGGLAYYLLGKFSESISTCQLEADDVSCQAYLALAYQKLGRHSDAEAMLGKIRASKGDNAAYEYAEIFAQGGDTAKALQWLATAMHLRSPSLEWLKQDPLLDPLRKEPRFQAIERELKFLD
jgi:TolB-like protein/Flp pilus assembly protein TadD